MSEHTPGAWEVRHNKNGTLGIEAKEPDGTYCQPAKINGDPDDEFYGPATRANARLIAAAPDLLEACRDLLMWMPCGEVPVEQAAAMQAAEAAIAKAERKEEGEMSIQATRRSRFFRVEMQLRA